MVDHDTLHEHGVCSMANAFSDNNNTNNGTLTSMCQEERLDHSIIYAVADLLLFSLCDLHLVSDNGFAKFGAELAPPPRFMYMLYREDSRNIPKLCNLQTPDEHAGLMTYGVGF